MPLVRRDDVFDRIVSLSQRDDDLIRFTFVHARIVRALRDKQRSFDFGDVVKGDCRINCALPSAVFGSPIRL